MIAGLRQVEDREGLGGLSGREEEGGDATFEGSDALLDRVLRRVHDAGVDVARFGETEQRRGVIGVVEGVAGGLVDGQGRAFVSPPAGCPTWICLVSKLQFALGSVASGVVSLMALLRIRDVF